MRRSLISASVAEADVAVIGGGAIGLASSWRLSQNGARVILVDESVGHGASSVAAGMLAPVTEVEHGEEELLQLNLESSRLYPDFAAELEETTGRSVGYRRCGTVLVARDRDDNAALEELYRFQARLGLSVQRLRSSECHRLEPALAANVRGGILVEGDHQVDSRALLAALEEACQRTGVEFVRSAASRVKIEGGRVAGADLADGGVVRSDRVVLAAGVWSASVNGLPDEVRPPVRPVKGQLLHLAGSVRPSFTAPLSGRNIRGLDVYLVVRGDGRVVVGATVEEQGFDASVTAGAVLQLLRDAYELVPGITELQLTETVAGLRPATPDNAPLIGAAGIEGLIMATGHYRNGILLTPVTAAAVTEIAWQGRTPKGLEAFSPRRFEPAETGSRVLQ